MCITYRSSTTQILSDLYFDLSRSLGIKCDGAVGLITNDILLVFGSLTKCECLKSNLKAFLPSRSLKVKCDCAIGIPTCGLPLMFNCNIWLIWLQAKPHFHYMSVLCPGVLCIRCIPPSGAMDGQSLSTQCRTRLKISIACISYTLEMCNSPINV